jgi:nucleotide-binding universal stress UspA family protein
MVAQVRRISSPGRRSAMSDESGLGPIAVEADSTVDGLRVVGYACDEAKDRGADLLLVRPYREAVPYSPTMPWYAPADLRDAAGADLQDAVRYARTRVGDSVEVHGIVIGGSRHAALLESARDARLLIVMRRHAQGAHRAIAAQSNLNLAGETDCPVIVVPPGWSTPDRPGPVYVGIDGSALSREAIEFAYATAAQRRAHLVVVHVGKTSGGRGGTRPLELTVAESLTGYAERYPRVRVTRLVTSQSVTDALVGASVQAGLLVVGAHAGRLPHDPNARRAIAAASCPIAVVKHPVLVRERHAGGVWTSIVAPTY